MSKERSFLLFTSIIVILGILARLYDLPSRVIEYHEQVTQEIISQPSLMDQIICTGNDNSPPLYQILTRWSYGLLKNITSKAFALRFISFLSGILGILITLIFLYKEKGKSAAIAGAVLSSFLLSYIASSIWARSSSLYLLLSTLSTIFWYKSVVTKEKDSYAGFTIATILNLYTHYFSIFLLCSQILISVIYTKKISKRLLSSLGVILIFFLPWFSEFIAHRAFTSEDFWIPTPGPIDILHLILSYFSNTKLLVCLIGIVLFELWGQYKRHKHLPKFSLVFPLFIMSNVSFVYLKSVFSTSVFVPRYFVGIYPAITFFIAFLIGRSKWAKLYIAMILLCFAYNILNIEEIFYKNTDWIFNQNTSLTNFKCILPDEF